MTNATELIEHSTHEARNASKSDKPRTYTCPLCGYTTTSRSFAFWALHEVVSHGTGDPLAAYERGEVPK